MRKTNYDYEVDEEMNALDRLEATDGHSFPLEILPILLNNQNFNIYLIKSQVSKYNIYDLEVKFGEETIASYHDFGDFENIDYGYIMTEGCTHNNFHLKLYNQDDVLYCKYN